MPDTTLDAQSNSPIVTAYRQRTPGSARLAEVARDVFPSGITHDSRHLKPYGIYVERARGSRKWDVDGHDYVDYYGGHGALLLGHCHPEVMAAAAEAMAEGTHFGANHPREIAWGEAIRRLVPSAERVRFTSSGTEATHMALRLARAFTGRRKVVRFRSHFHGWHDHMTSGVSNHFDGSPAIGVLPGVAEAVVLLDPNDVEAVDATLAGGDVAALIIEPTGGSTGLTAIAPGFLAALREVTRRHGTLLVFDEVVTGFRVSPGGAQAHFKVIPDLTTLAKIVAGGLPGGAVVGRKDVLDGLDFDAMEKAGREKIAHPGTFNANPVSAAAGTKALEIIGSTDACARANAYGDALRRELNEVLAESKVPWASYGTFSTFHLFMNPAVPVADPFAFNPLAHSYETLKDKPKALVHKLRLAMLTRGIDLNGQAGGIISATHDEEDRRRTVAAFRDSLVALRREGELPG